VVLVDVVVVSYNNRDQLRGCVEPLASDESIHVIVVDNASTDGSLAAVGDLPVESLALTHNHGFGAGCNAGWRRGNAPFVLFLNPDARIEGRSLRRLAHALESDPRVGLAAPRIVHEDGSLHFSQRHFPSLRSSYAQAFFLHRLMRRASWTNELERDERAYAHPASPDWVSGACMILRRDDLERLGGFDERFFLYCEDTDLCRRVRNAGLDIRYEPRAVAVHDGGASAPRARLLPVLAASRVRYAQKHDSRRRAALQRIAVALEGLSHTAVSGGGIRARAGHARAATVAARRLPITDAWPNGQVETPNDSGRTNIEVTSAPG
jgi:N-acetylglucosaminyl-diphospho-decaprenol L-rhamnosyltransferase